MGVAEMRTTQGKKPFFYRKTKLLTPLARGKKKEKIEPCEWCNCRCSTVCKKFIFCPKIHFVKKVTFLGAFIGQKSRF